MENIGNVEESHLGMRSRTELMLAETGGVSPICQNLGILCLTNMVHHSFKNVWIWVLELVAENHNPALSLYF